LVNITLSVERRRSVRQYHGSGARAWPCQKPPWGPHDRREREYRGYRLEVLLGVTDELPPPSRKRAASAWVVPSLQPEAWCSIGATNDNTLRAFDSKTGKELWTAKLDMSAHAVPITYQGKNGKQYVAIVAAGASAIDDPAPPDSEVLVVYALP